MILVMPAMSVEVTSSDLGCAFERRDQAGEIAMRLLGTLDAFEHGLEVLAHEIAHRLDADLRLRRLPLLERHPLGHALLDGVFILRQGNVFAGEHLALVVENRQRDRAQVEPARNERGIGQIRDQRRRVAVLGFRVIPNDATNRRFNHRLGPC